VCLLFVFTFVPLVAAQEDAPDTTRDSHSLAERYLGYDGEPVVLPPPPIYEVGDTLEFWVSKGDTPVRVNASLAAAAPSVYVWVEDGLNYNEEQLGEQAAQLSAAYGVLQLSQNYVPPLMETEQSVITDPSALMHVPDVENDPHLYILYTTDLHEDRDVVHNPNDSLPAAFVPGNFSNEHEIIYVNTTPYTDVPLHDSLYFNALVGALYPFIMSENNPTQAPWLADALNLSLRLQLQQITLTAEEAQAFLDAPDTSILRLPALTNRAQTISGQQLFLNYFVQRYGNQAYRDLFLQPGDGIAPVDAALLKNEIVDPGSGAEVSGLDAFADFVMANVINFPIGDGRYVHLRTPLEESQRALTTAISDLDDDTPAVQTVNQFGTLYLRHTPQQAETVIFHFEGAETVARLRMPFDFDPEDPFYWSGRTSGQDTTMTRTFDLRDVDEATLTFDAWYDLAGEWNYGYVSISTDDGATWIPLPSTSEAQGTTSENRHGIAYGPAFTGISNPAGPRPFPIMGVVIANDGITLGEVAPDSPAEEAGLQPDDVIIGYDGELWSTTPNVLGLLSNYAPGDTVNLYIQRGDEQIDVPLVLGAHPTRVVQPDPLWLAQTVDLTPFTGDEILLRFEYVSLPGRENNGFAVNNIAIPEIDYEDDGDWTLGGWQSVTSTVPQRWLVQVLTTGTATVPPRVRPLIGVDSTETSGEWTFSLQADETLLIAISGLNDDTYEPASFNIELREG
jgi:hypothetical protein